MELALLKTYPVNGRVYIRNKNKLLFNLLIKWTNCIQKSHSIFSC